MLRGEIREGALRRDLDDFAIVGKDRARKTNLKSSNETKKTRDRARSVKVYQKSRRVIGVRQDDLFEFFTNKDAVTEDALPIADEAEALSEDRQDVVRDGKLMGRVHVR